MRNTWGIYPLITTRAQARKQEEEEQKLKKRITAITKPLEGERRDVEEGAIEKSGESEVGERMAEQGRWGSN
jgi:multidrug efflux pump subunit AcrA (membrane-fusion protein)